MKTIHLKSKNKRLIKKLYQFLKDDPLFHFFYEPELVIRISDKGCLKKVKKYLMDNSHMFEEYDYPVGQGYNKKTYCFECAPVVIKNLDLFLSVYHSQSVAALTMNKKDYLDYLGRICHTGFNIGSYSYYSEAKTMIMWGVERTAQLSVLGWDDILETYRRK